MKVKIKNFQSIKEAELEVKGFTVVVGQNNVGKSAVRRAVQGALSNAVGTSFVREGEKTTQVELETPKLDLVWEKGKNKNSYKVNGHDYEKVGRGAPSEIEEAGFKPITLANNEKIDAQFAGTHSPIFLLDKSGPMIAELISSVSRLGVINQANRLCDKDAREVRSKNKLRDSDLKLVEQRLQQFTDLPSLLELNRQNQENYEKIVELAAQLEELGGYDRELEELNALISVLEPVIHLEIPKDTFEYSLEELEDLDDYVARLEEHKAVIEALSPVSQLVVPDPAFEQAEELVQLVKWIKDIEGLGTDIKRLLPVSKLEIPTVDDQIAAEINELNALVSKLGAFEDEIQRLAGAHAKKCEEIDKLEAELHEELGELELCPVCETTISK